MALMNLFSPNQLTEKLMPNGEFYNESVDVPFPEPKKEPLEVFADNLSAVISGFSNFAIQYNFQVMAIVMLAMSASVCTTDDDGCQKNIQEIWVHTSVVGAVFLGCSVGMLTMGYIGDRVGRNNTLAITLLVATIGAVCSASFAFGSSEDIYGNIAISRFVLGVGCGGVYPLSAAKAAEDAARHLVEEHRAVGINIMGAARAFFWQVPGVVSPWLVGYILTFSTMHVNQKWRLLLGVGSIPLFIVMCLTLWEIYLRQYVVKVKSSNKVGCESVDSVQNALFAKHRRDEMLVDPGYRRLLFVTGTCSFIFDMSFYGVSLFGGVIVFAMTNDDDFDVSSDTSLRYVSSRMMMAMSVGVPSVVLTILSVKYLGTRITQKYGFLGQGLMFLILAVCFNPLNADSVFAVYCFLVFALSSGSNVTTFCLPTEIFPYEIRSTYNGAAASFGKLGAFVGVVLFGRIALYTSLPIVMIFCGVLSLFGAAITHIYLEEEPEVIIDNNYKDSMTDL